MKTVLVTEDNDIDYEIIHRSLQEVLPTLKVERAETGEDCLARLEDETSNPHIVIMDLNLPGMTGDEVIHELKSHIKLRELPIIVVTSSSNPRDVEACYYKGANSYHLKPLQTQRFRSVIREVANYWLVQAYLPELGDR
ncbi:Hypothetical protein PBC10988_6100 [Planctomycetales bacterium 10988]|nr:Hypothetical protein PBC10988_6100 [Planctomycetales bacterium 10988]